MAKTQIPTNTNPRLVYSPKAFVFVEDYLGIQHVLTDYVVSGSVDRKINQVSTASVVIRNPKLKWTGGQGNIGQAVFHPMDRITIFLQRLSTHPIQVFSGYLDDTPWLALYPGTVTLNASCTLKRLLYTQWDPALPFTIEFLSQYGWSSNGQGQLQNLSAVSTILGPSDPTTQNNQKTSGGTTTGTTPSSTDGGIGSLLFEVLNKIGGWDESDIYIEALPPNLLAPIKKLYKTLLAQTTQSETQLESFYKAVIGSSSYGSAAPQATALASSAINPTPTDAKNIVQQIDAVATTHGIPSDFAICTCLCETSFSLSSVNSFNNDNATGWYQFTSANPYPSANLGSDWVTIARNLTQACTYFCQAALAALTTYPGISIADRSTWETWAEDTQQPGAGAYASLWASNLALADKYLSQYGSQSSSTTLPLAGHQTQGSSSTQTTTAGNQGSSNTNPGTNTQTYAQMEGLWIAAGGDPKVASIMAAIATHESQGEATIIQQGQPYATTGWGLWQITPGNSEPSVGIDQALLDPLTNAKAAVIKYKAAGFQPWEADYATGLYKQYLQNVAPVAPSSTKTGATNLTGNNTGITSVAPGAGSDAIAASFALSFDFPTIEATAGALLLVGQKSYMNDEPILPFIQQLAQGSMRDFQSLPNGNFYAFYPDYFGGFGKTPYWEIDDIEILDGNIQLSDQALATHVYVTGDTLYGGLGQPVDINEQAASTGVVTVSNFDFDSFLYKGQQGGAQAVNGSTAGKLAGQGPGQSNKKSPKNNQEFFANQVMSDPKTFLERYGVRPLVQNAPFIRTHFFELLLAFQIFELLWARQFQTTFSFTFMPEVYPGGIVSFPNHGIQCYVEEVLHTFDYTEGFTTQATLTAPSSTGAKSATMGMVLSGQDGGFNATPGVDTVTVNK